LLIFLQAGDMTSKTSSDCSYFRSTRNQKITDSRAVWLASCLRNSTAVVSLDFSENLIGDVGVRAIANVLTANASIVELELASHLKLRNSMQSLWEFDWT